MPTKPPYAWLDGEFVPFDDAKIHVSTQCVARGSSVFEGVRAYWNPEREELNVFKLPDHIQRLAESMKVMRYQLPYPVEDIGTASLELLRRCNFREDVRLRPVVYEGFAAPGATLAYSVTGNFIGAFVTANPERSMRQSEVGLNVAISSWRRIEDAAMPPRVKASANYLNSRYAELQARVDGYDSAILLNSQGKVSETGGACVFVVRRGRIATPPTSADILESITRDTLIQLFREELGMAVDEREIDRSELYIADEVFRCGTAVDINPIVSVDRYEVGNGQRGPITKSIQDAFYAATNGDTPKYCEWLQPAWSEKAQPTKV